MELLKVKRKEKCICSPVWRRRRGTRVEIIQALPSPSHTFTLVQGGFRETVRGRTSLNSTWSVFLRPERTVIFTYWRCVFTLLRCRGNVQIYNTREKACIFSHDSSFTDKLLWQEIDWLTDWLISNYWCELFPPGVNKARTFIYLLLKAQSCSAAGLVCMCVCVCVCLCVCLVIFCSCLLCEIIRWKKYLPFIIYLFYIHTYYIIYLYTCRYNIYNIYIINYFIYIYIFLYTYFIYLFYSRLPIVSICTLDVVFLLSPFVLSKSRLQRAHLSPSSR